MFLLQVLQQSAIWNWSSFFFNALCSLIASLFFLFFVLWFFKPIIKISPFLCKIGHDDNVVYLFKFINKSFFSAYDIKVELHQKRTIPMGNGQFNDEYEKLKLINSELFHIPARPTFISKDKGNKHCLIFKSREKLLAILSNETEAIVLRVSLKHGLTGLSKKFEQEYANVGDVQIGKFKPGTKFGVIPFY